VSANEFRYEPGEQVTWQGASGQYYSGKVISHKGIWVRIQVSRGTWVEHQDNVQLELPFKNA